MYNMKRGEDSEQIGVIEWANWNTNRFPELKLLFHIPNGGKRSATEAARFKAMGVKAGVPDLCLPVPRGGFAGLYIEMKYGKNKTTDKQNEWIQALKEQGYKVEVCWGGVEATQTLEAYLQQTVTILIDSAYSDRPHTKPLQIYCVAGDEEAVRTALQAAAVGGNCPFPERFVPPCCGDLQGNGTKEDCAACVDKYIDFCTDPHAEY